MNQQREFANPYEAGYDAGRYGANTFNAHFKWFSTKEKMEDWSRGNKEGAAKKLANREELRKIKS